MTGKYYAQDLLSDKVDASIGGEGEATIWVTDSLDAHIGSVDTLNYYGAPSVNSSIATIGGSFNSLGEKE